MVDITENLNEPTNPIVLQDEELEVSPIIALVEGRYQQSRTDRREVEDRWLTSYHNYRGRYSDDHSFLDSERSRVFIKITKTKTLAAYGQVLDIILADNDVPISIEATPMPLGTTSNAHIDPKDQGEPEEPVDVIGFEGDGNDSVGGESLTQRAQRMVKRAFGNVKAKEGPAIEAGQIQIDPAALAAKDMEKKIKDQMIESGGASNLKRTLLECVLLGTGVMKGPFFSQMEYPRWTKEGIYTPELKIVPKSEHVSIWNIYPDPDAANMEDAEWLVERHRKSLQELSRLKRQPFFRDNAIDEAVKRGTNYSDEYWEQQIKEGSNTSTQNRFEILEYWGVMPSRVIDELEDFELPEGIEGQEQYNVNCWVCNGQVIRLVLNPFKPSRIPYFAVPYEEDPYNFFGVGLPENMEDSQVLMNGFTRMAVDNAALSGNVILEIDEENLVPGQDMSIYPGKIFRRQGGAPGQAIFSTKFQNTTQENMLVFDKFRQMADDSTGIPSALHGQTGISGIGRTASGISMLLNAASLSIKTVIKNIDDYLLEPMAKAYFAFNMQFDFDEKYLGDLAIKSQGVSSLISREAQSQRLLQLLQVTATDQRLAARLNDEYIMGEIAKSLGLDPAKVTLSPELVAIKIQEMQALQGGPQGPQAPQPGGETNPANEIAGFAAPPEPGTDQFSANTGGGAGEQV